LPDNGPTGDPAGLVQDQASGLRALFRDAQTQWTLVLQPSVRSDQVPDRLARRARTMAAQSGSTLLIDAARTQVAAAMGLRLRFDVAHAMAGDCDIGEVCVAGGDSLWVLPAARAWDTAADDEQYGIRLGSTLGAMSTGMRNGMLIVPAARVGCLRFLPEEMRVRQALIPVSHGSEYGSAVLTAIRLAASEAGIDTFHLLFLGMSGAAAGRLLSGMAAIAKRHFGATLLAAPQSLDAKPASRRAADGNGSVESVS
jgi:hypothetical protein